MNDLTSKVNIYWEWVESHVSSRERLKDISIGSTKDAVLEQLNKAVETAKLKVRPAMIFEEKKITALMPSSVNLEGISLSSRELSSHIKGATHACIYLVTIGQDLEDAASNYMKMGDHLFGYLLYRVGSFAVESMAQNAENALRDSFKGKRMSVSMRFSPGYCDWPIEEQFKLQRILDFSKIGVTLTDNCMMIPKKSISALVGVGNENLFSKIISPCSVCNMKVCDYRRSG